jgi:hypothetical protein
MLENGFLYDNSLNYGSDFAVYLHDQGGARKSTIAAQDGSAFSFVSANGAAYSSIYQTRNREPDPDWDWAAYQSWATNRSPNFVMAKLVGYRGDEIVARQALRTGYHGEMQFGRKFANVTKVELIYYPPYNYMDDFWSDGSSEARQYWCDEWCGGVYFYNMTVGDAGKIAPPNVPLPASGLLLLTGGIALATGRKIRSAGSPRQKRG